MLIQWWFCPVFQNFIITWNYATFGIHIYRKLIRLFFRQRQKLWFYKTLNWKLWCYRFFCLFILKWLLFSLLKEITTCWLNENKTHAFCLHFCSFIVYLSKYQVLRSLNWFIKLKWFLLNNWSLFLLVNFFWYTHCWIPATYHYFHIRVDKRWYWLSLRFKFTLLTWGHYRYSLIRNFCNTDLSEIICILRLRKYWLSAHTFLRNF